MDIERAVTDLAEYFGEKITWSVREDGTIALTFGEEGKVMTGRVVNGDLVIDMAWAK